MSLATLGPMYKALHRIVNASGMAEGVEVFPYATNSAVKIAWRRAAKVKKYIRPVTEAERAAYLENRRAVREVLLAMVEVAARNERADTIAPVARALDRVVWDIHHTATSTWRFWTLTEAGAACLNAMENL